MAPDPRTRREAPTIRPRPHATPLAHSMPHGRNAIPETTAPALRRAVIASRRTTSSLRDASSLSCSSKTKPFRDTKTEPRSMNPSAVGVTSLISMFRWQARCAIHRAAGSDCHRRNTRWRRSARNPESLEHRTSGWAFHDPRQFGGRGDQPAGGFDRRGRDQSADTTHSAGIGCGGVYPADSTGAEGGRDCCPVGVGPCGD